MLKTVIIGAGGFGREVLALIKNINIVQSKFDVLGFVDDGIQVGTEIYESKVLGGLDDLLKLEAEAAVLAIADTRTRESIIPRIPKSIQFPNIIHPLAIFSDTSKIKIGQGNIICAGNIFTIDITIGNFNIFNLSSTIGHDTNISDFCSIMPGVNISGGATLEKGVYVGTGAKLIKATTLGSNSTIGAGAVVETDIAQNITAVGVPAKPLMR